MSTQNTTAVLGAYLKVGMRIPLAPGYWGTVESIRRGETMDVKVKEWQGKKEGGPTIPPSRVYVGALDIPQEVMENPDRDFVARYVARIVDSGFDSVMRLYDGMHDVQAPE